MRDMATKITKFIDNKDKSENLTYYTDYPTEPIGGGNPYYRCKSCGVSDPEINGRLDGHRSDCEWILNKKKEV